MQFVGYDPKLGDLFNLRGYFNTHFNKFLHVFVMFRIFSYLLLWYILWVFSHHRKLIFRWSLTYCKFPHVSRTLLSFLGDLINAVVWRVSMFLFRTLPVTFLSLWEPFPVHQLPIFTNPSARAGYDKRSIFKGSLTGLNSEFSFS